MDASTISFYLAAAVALGSALGGMLVRRSDRALGCFALASGALAVPLLQLGASLVAAIAVMSGVVGAALVLAALDGDSVGRGSASPDVRRQKPVLAWIAAGLALLGFTWVLLATGSRQVVETGVGLARGFGESPAVHDQLFGRFLVPVEIVGLTAIIVLVASALAADRRTGR